MSLNGWLPLWLQVLGLHTLDGLFCFLGFRLDLCFEPLDFREGRAVRRCEQRVTGGKEEQERKTEEQGVKERCQGAGDGRERKQWDRLMRRDRREQQVGVTGDDEAWTVEMFASVSYGSMSKTYFSLFLTFTKIFKYRFPIWNQRFDKIHF